MMRGNKGMERGSLKGDTPTICRRHRSHQGDSPPSLWAFCAAHVYMHRVMVRCVIVHQLQVERGR